MSSTRRAPILLPSFLTETWGSRWADHRANSLSSLASQRATHCLSSRRAAEPLSRGVLTLKSATSAKACALDAITGMAGRRRPGLASTKTSCCTQRACAAPAIWRRSTKPARRRNSKLKLPRRCSLRRQLQHSRKTNRSTNRVKPTRLRQ